MKALILNVRIHNRFREHGDPTLIQDTVPVLVEATSPNPYDNPLNPPENSPAEAFCAMKWFSNMDSLGRRFYKLANVASEEDAIRYGFAVTHLGHCGACSSLQDLGVYIGRNLTTPTRICGALGILSDSLIDKCLKRIGFSDLCIPIWRYNVINTREKCFWPCLLSWIANEPFNKPDGSLNDCLQCDEDASGPNFKYFAGRTRRGSGIPSSIYRPPEAIYHMSHCYWYGAL